MDKPADLALVEALRRECRETIETFNEESKRDGSGDPTYTEMDYVSDLFSGWQEHREYAGPIIYQMLGLPADPWPGLTGDDVGRMIKGRKREAARREIANLAAKGRTNCHTCGSWVLPDIASGWSRARRHSTAQ